MTSSQENRENDRVVLTTEDGSSRAVVCLYGAHVIEWSQNNGDDQLLFLSERAVLDGSRAIRGGIPLIFPQFGGRGDMQSHGFARNMKWSVVSATKSSACLRLESSPTTRQHWPNMEFVTEYTVTLSPTSLRCGWMVRNTNKASPLSFHTALHTYFRINDIANCSIKGKLDGTAYIDQLKDGGAEMKQQGDAITFEVGEVDRIYTNVTNELSVVDGDGRHFHIVKTNFPDAVVWNPHIEKAKRMAADFGPEEWRTMVCVEAGSIVPGVTLQPNQEWQGVLEIYTEV